MSAFFISVAVAFFFGLIGMPVFLGLARLVGLYAIVGERHCNVYVLFGKVIDIVEEPGLYFLWTRQGWRALVVNWLGQCHELDMRLDQEYLRSQPVEF